MNKEQMGPLATVKDDTVELDNISVYHFGRLFWDAWNVFNIMSEDRGDPYYVNTPFTITSGCEPAAAHSPISRHYSGNAIDVRIRNLVTGSLRYTPFWWCSAVLYFARLAVEMPEYVFVLESDHVHIQIGHKNIKGRPYHDDLPNFYDAHN